jgi:hypothetical protein
VFRSSPDDSTQPSYSGHATFWGNFNLNQQSSNSTSTSGLAKRVKEGIIEQSAMRSMNSYKDLLKVSEDLNQHLLLFINVAEVHDDVPSRPPQGKPWQYFVPCFLPIVPSFGRSAVHF